MTNRVRPIRPARDRLHVDRKRQQKIEATHTFDEYVDEIMEHFRNPRAAACPDCGRYGDDHKNHCLHRR